MDPNFALYLLTDPNKQNCLAKTLTPAFLNALKDHTYSKSDTELGEKLGFNSPSAMVSQIKSGRLYLKIISLHNIAAEIGITYGKLAAIICKKMLVVSDPAKRRSFLSGLQITTQLTDGRYFREKIGGIRKEEQFLKDGIVPSKWIELIDDPQERIRIISTHCGKPLVPKNYQKKNGKPKNGKAFPDDKKVAEGSAAPQPEGVPAPAAVQDELPTEIEEGKAATADVTEESVPKEQAIASEQEDVVEKTADQGGVQADQKTPPSTTEELEIVLPEDVSAPESVLEQKADPQSQPDGVLEPDGTADPVIAQPEDIPGQATRQENPPLDPDWSEKLEQLASIPAKPPEMPVSQEQPQKKSDLQGGKSDMPCTNDKFFYEIACAIFAAGRASIMQNEDDVFVGRLTKQLRSSGYIVITNPSDPDSKIIHFTIMDQEENYFDRKFDIGLLFPSIPTGKPL